MGSYELKSQPCQAETPGSRFATPRAHAAKPGLGARAHAGAYEVAVSASWGSFLWVSL